MINKDIDNGLHFNIEDILKETFENETEKNKRQVYVVEEFCTDQLLTQQAANKTIDQKNYDMVTKDADSKIGFRSSAIRWLFFCY